MECYKIENLTFYYPEKNVPALKDISITINRGEFLAICGRSGSGKSTFLRMLKPLLSPKGKKQGNLYFEGSPLFELNQKSQCRKIGFVMQNYENQIVTDKVWHELAFGLESLSLSKGEIRSRVAEMASFFGIQGWFHKKVTELSGGQKQILNLASIMVMQPEVIILDEPTSQLDPVAAGEFIDILSKINRELGTTIIISEHRLDEILPISDRLAVMDEGRIMAIDSPDRADEIIKKLDIDLLISMPVPIRVHSEVLNNMRCPITVREGRIWLSKMVEGLERNNSYRNKENIVNEQEKIDNKPIKENDEIAVNVKNIWYKYEKNSEYIVKDLSFKVYKGEIYSIVGGNGSGKSTTLSIISGVRKAIKGKVEIDKNMKVSALPQSPQSIFVKDTVRKDLYEILSFEKISCEEKLEKVDNIAEMFELKNILNSHPFDLSGGEQQRAALAKVMLTEPDILILDEPSKGMDACFKKKLCNFLKSLKVEGITVIMVSHDLEFCAEVSDRCGLYFDGNIVCEEEPKEFFSNKTFYTTAACRMANGIIPKAVVKDDIVNYLNGYMADSYGNSDNSLISTVYFSDLENEKDSGNKFESYNNDQSNYSEDYKFNFLKNGNEIEDEEIKEINHSEKTIRNMEISNKINKKLSFRTYRMLVTAAVILILMPATIFIGSLTLGDRKYYIISLLLIIEAILPFIMCFERRKPKAREVIMISVFCAIAVAGRAAFFMVPQFKPVAALVIISGICFGAETGFLTGALISFVSNFFFGQGPWTPWQMFAFGIIGFLAGIVYVNKGLDIKRIPLCIFGGIVTIFVYGGIINPASVIMYQSNPTIEMFISAYALGFPFDIVHSVSTIIFLFIFAKPIIKKIDRIKIKYGIIRV